MAKRKGRLWTAEEDEKARAMFERGEKVADIARALGRTERAASSRLHLLGVKRSWAKRTTSVVEQLAGCKPARDHYRLIELSSGMKARRGHAPGWWELI